MTPKEKALELVQKYNLVVLDTALGGSNQRVKKCALIAVDEVIKVCPFISKKDCETIEQLRANDYEFISYWQEVKQEIEKL